MNLLKFYYKLNKAQRKLLLDCINQYDTLDTLEYTSQDVMFADYSKTIKALREYYALGTEHMYPSDYAVLRILEVLGAYLPKIKPDPLDRAIEEARKVWL